MDRRLLLSIIAGSVVTPGITRALPLPPPRRLRLVNAHTGESFDGAYRSETGPIGAAMQELSVFLRDFRAGATIAIDVGLLDFLAAVMAAAGQTTATVLSGYRTPRTNAMLARTRFGVAENSQHLYGRALDVHFGGNLAAAMQAAREMKRGGVGWYPSSHFIHLDSGPVRNWNLDGNGLGSLLLERRKIPFNADGVPIARKTASRPLMTAETTAEAHHAGVASERIARLRALARAAYRPGG